MERLRLAETHILLEVAGTDATIRLVVPRPHGHLGAAEPRPLFLLRTGPGDRDRAAELVSPHSRI